MRFFLLTICILIATWVHAQRPCGTQHRYEKLLMSDIQILRKDEGIQQKIKQSVHSSSLSKIKTNSLDELIIPVVFHVVYNRSHENIPDEKILEQLEILNRDFKALNEDVQNIPAAFAPFLGSLNIKFVLANRDPNGNYTSGVVRSYTTKGDAFRLDLDDVKSSETGGVDAWDPNNYLNIWICNLENAYLGYSSFPVEAGTPKDGFVVGYPYVGIAEEGAFNLGRTAVHELGHYFGLRHIWGDVVSCAVDDDIEDTPPQYTHSKGNPEFPKFDKCSPDFPGIMFMNYMDYTNDSSLLMFTQEQVQYMESVIWEVRSSLLNSYGYVPESGLDLGIVPQKEASLTLCDYEFIPVVQLKNYANQAIESYLIQLYIDEELIEEVAITDEPTIDIDTLIYLSPIQLSDGLHSIRYHIQEVNGLAQDDNPENDSFSQEVWVQAEPIHLPFYEDFESEDLSDRGIRVYNPDGNYTWERSEINLSTSGNYSYFIDNYSYNPFEVEDYHAHDDIRLPFIDMTDYQSVEMSFSVAAAQYTPLHFNNDWDTLQVLVTLDCGETYELVYEKYAHDLVTYDEPLATPFQPKSSQWRTDVINLSDYIGYDRVGVVIRNISSFENNIYIDNLKIVDGHATFITESTTTNPVVLYPNPVRDKLYIKDADRVHKAYIINQLGQVVLSVKGDDLSDGIHVSQLPAGIYYLHIQDVENSSTSLQFVILEE